ncbi:MAG TPA: signal peptidase I [Spirochaetota bacterium]|nr:signal peptidase I [Spirochaetota bacterium]HPC41079.1 signal peptidase I [Spirochaetota bacterium]HQJ70938.1 signal peptidase I [Spirochaetota bacterium]HRS77845.1 signal peptidase I [Spirochaetota bacterium]HRT75443.1 signal peptidase I [Spirochaetota bacterium]
MNYQERSGNEILIKIIAAAAGLVAGFVICRIAFISFTMPDASMEPNLKKDDLVIIMRHVTPRKGDIILFKNPAEPGRVLVRRIAAVEGETVEIRDRTFRVNNGTYEFPWKTKSRDRRVFPMNFTFRDNMPAVKIGRGSYFVLSDDLDRGFDSRSFGPIPEDLVIGRMIYKR